MFHPERVDRLGILNVPHPERMLHTLRTSFGQLRRSWYMFFFQIPWLPERLLRRGGRRVLRGASLRRHDPAPTPPRTSPAPRRR